MILSSRIRPKRERWLNRRVEMWNKLKQWRRAGRRANPGFRLAAGGLLRPGYHYDSLGRLLLESKDDMRRRGALSPDEGDAVALTFARPVAPSNFHRRIVCPPSGLV